MQNSDASLSAIVNPNPITIGQMALLDMVGCPLIMGEYDDLPSTLLGLWLLSMPIERAVEAAKDKDGAIVWGNGISPEEYRRRLKAALDGITAFYRMLPRSEFADKKKGSETDSSRSS